MSDERKKANIEARDVWNENAAFWDERMGEGNDFVETLLWPATMELLELKVGERVLDIACGNGLSSRRLAESGAQVVAFDFAEQMIAYARERTIVHTQRIQYHVLDATDEAALLALGKGSFTAAVSNMALFDMAEIDPDRAMVDQPRTQPVFHRPLEVLLGSCFQAGFVLDRLREPAFPADHPAGKNPLSWGRNYSDIPPVLVARVRLK